MADGVPVVVGPVGVADVEVEDEVIDEAGQVEDLFELLELGAAGEAAVDQAHHGLPGGGVAVHRNDG